MYPINSTPESVAETVAALRSTEKGQLKYDSYIGNDEETKAFLDSVSTPRSIGQARLTVDVNGIHVNKNDVHFEAYHNDARKEKCVAATVKNDIDHIHASLQKKNEMGGESYVISPQHYLFIEKKLSNARECVDEKVKKEAEKKRVEFMRNDMLLMSKSTKQLELSRLETDQRESITWQRLKASELQQSEDARRNQNNLRESHRHHAKEQYDRLQKVDQEARLKENERLKILEEERQHQVLADILPQQAEVESISTRLAALMASCRHPQCLHISIGESLSLMNLITTKIAGTVDRARRGDATDSEIGTVAELVAESRKIVESVAVHVAEANRRGGEELAAALETEKKKKAADEIQKANQLQNVSTTAGNNSTTAVSTASNLSLAGSAMSCNTGSALLLNSPADIVERFQSLHKQLEQTAAQCTAFIKDSSCSKDRFDLQKAVNTPVNTISPMSGTHVLDKLSRLLTLLAGQSVEIGGRPISTRKHTVGVLFCKDLLAKKIVKQGEEQVSSNHDSAFAIAAVAIGIWCVHPDVGELILANFYLRCPYLAPYYMPREGHEARDDYYRSLGYSVDDSGEVEQQDKFLRRMSGFTRLYAAIIVTSPPPQPRGSSHRGSSANTSQHPHGIEHAWVWLSNILNVEPRPDITATVLHDFLFVTGFALRRAYGRQFAKVIRTLTSEYLPRIIAVTPAGASGPVTRLEGFLRECVAGRLPMPEGLIQPQFWNT